MEIEVTPPTEPEPVVGNFPSEQPVEPTPESDAAPIEDIQGAPDDQSVEPQFDEHGQPVEPEPAPTTQPAAPEPDPELTRRAAMTDRYMSDPVARFHLAQRERELASETGEIEPGWVTSTLANPPAAVTQRAQPTQAPQQPQYTPQQMHDGYRGAIMQSQQKIRKLVDDGRYADAEDERARQLQIEWNYSDWQTQQSGQQLQSVTQQVEQDRQRAKAQREQDAKSAQVQAFRKEVRETVEARKEFIDWKGPGSPLVYKDPAFEKIHKKIGGGATDTMTFRESVDMALELMGRLKPAQAAQPTARRAVAQAPTGAPPRSAQMPPPSRGMIRIPVSAPPRRR